MTPFAPTPRSAAQRATAYRILGVDPSAVAAAPKISRLIAKLEDGKATALEALRASDLPEARQFMSKYDNTLLPAFVRRVLPIEAFAIAAGLSPTRLWGVIAEVFRLQKMQLGAIKAAERHEAIVEVSSATALRPDGVEDRMAHLKHMGFTPSPRGSTINIGVTATATAQSAAVAAVALPAPEDTIRRMVEARQRAALGPAATKELPAATPAADMVPRAFMPRAREPITVDAEYEEADD